MAEQAIEPAKGFNVIKFRCGAQKWRSGAPAGVCQRQVKSSGLRCWRHSGDGPSGPVGGSNGAHPAEIAPPNGGGGKALTVRAKELYAEAMASGTGLLDMRQSLAWLMAAQGLLIERLPSGDSAELRSVVLTKLRDGYYDDALALLENGVRHDQLLRQITDLAERHGTLAARAGKILIESENTLSVRQVIGLCEKLIAIVVEETDKASARKIVARLQKALVSENSKIALAASELGGVVDLSEQKGEG